MGWITNRHMRTGTHLAKNAKVGKRSGVLRKIVGTTVIDGMEYEQLECGHIGRALVTIGTDFFGTQPANSRRCMNCKKNQSN